MNKKQLKISLVILGFFAIAIICIGLFAGTGNKKNVDYDKELVSELENLGKMDLSSVNNFKDGVYAVDSNFTDAVNPQFTGFEKKSNVITINDIGGYKKYICRVSESIKYEKATTYNLHCVEITLENDIKNISELIDKVKSLEIRSDSININKDAYTLKVNDSGEIRLNDISVRLYNLKDRNYVEGTKPEDVQKVQDEYTRDAEKLNEKILPEEGIPEEDGVSVE